MDENVPPSRGVLMARRFNGPVPSRVYEFRLSKTSVPAKCSPSSVTVCGAVMALPKMARALPPSGAIGVHLLLSDQLPEESVDQVASRMVRVRLSTRISGTFKGLDPLSMPSSGFPFDPKAINELICGSSVSKFPDRKSVV